MTYNLNTKNKAETLVNIKNHNQIDNKIVFAFSFFNGYSIKLNDFNNYYFNNLDATKAVSDFFKTIKDISRFNSNNFYLPAIKTQLHYNEFKDSKIIERIEKVLIKGYGMSEKIVDNFEKSKEMLDDKENENEEFFRIMIDSARNGEYSSITDFIKDYDDFYNFV